MMQWLGALIREVCYGVSAGAAVWHGSSLPEPSRRRGTAGTARSAIVRLEIIRSSDGARRQPDLGSPRFGGDWRSPA